MPKRVSPTLTRLFGSKNDPLAALSEPVIATLLQIAHKNDLSAEQMALELLTEAVWAREESVMASLTGDDYARAPLSFRMADALLKAAVDAGADELQITLENGSLVARVLIDGHEQGIVPTNYPWPGVTLLERLERRCGLYAIRWNPLPHEARFQMVLGGVRIDASASYLSGPQSGLRFTFSRQPTGILAAS